MKKTALFLLSLAAGIFAISAKVDYNALEVDMTMNRSEYNELLSKFENADNSLTDPQVSRVYYGFALTPGYAPGADYSRISDAIEARRYSDAAAMADSALVANPVSLELLILDLRANELRPDRSLETINRSRRLTLQADMIANAIIDSGRGTSADDPFYVTSKGDMMTFLQNVMCVDKILGHAKVGDIDAVKFTLPGRDRMHILYFDNTREEKAVGNGSGK